MKVKCPVIEDLLPLYIDGVCSDESESIIEEHIKECKECADKLRIQKSEITVDDSVIKGNLKSKEPFKRIRKFQLMRLAVILLTIPLLLLTFTEVRGDGVGFSALYGRYKVERFLSRVEKEQFENAAKYISFTGGKYEEIEYKEEAKKEWHTGLQGLKDEGIEIISHRQNSIITDDRFTSGYIIVSVRYSDIIYDFRLFISTNKGKIEPGSLSLDINSQAQKPTEVEMMLINRISNVFSTFNPG